MSPRENGMQEFATRTEVNGLGVRVDNVVSQGAAIKEAIDTIKTSQRDIWDAIANDREEFRTEDKRIEKIVHDLSISFAKQNVFFLIGNAILVAVIVKYLH